MFGVNDFDETLPGPFEYDVKRMSTSFTIAGRNNGFTKPDIHAVTLASVRAYREAMAEFAKMGTMDVWYAHLTEQDLLAGIRKLSRSGRQDEEGSEEGREDRPGDRRQGPHARQPAGSFQTGGDGRRSIPDHQSAADRDPGSRPPRDRGVLTRPASAGDPGAVPRLPEPPSRTTDAICWSASRSSMSPARSSASAASEHGRTSPCSRGGTNAIPSSSRSRKRPPRYSRTTFRRAGSSNLESVLSKVSA